MITLVSLWESGWLDQSVEAFMWRQLVEAFGVDRLIFCPEALERRKRPEQFPDLDAALADTEGTPVYLIPQHGQALQLFEHPEDAVYIFGNACQSNINNARRDGTIIVQVPTPKPVDFFAVNAAAMVLYDRMMKSERRSKG